MTECSFVQSRAVATVIFQARTRVAWLPGKLSKGEFTYKLAVAVSPPLLSFCLLSVIDLYDLNTFKQRSHRNTRYQEEDLNRLLPIVSPFKKKERAGDYYEHDSKQHNKSTKTKEHDSPFDRRQPRSRSCQRQRQLGEEVWYVMISALH
jgi:hypothetical protein